WEGGGGSVKGALGHEESGAHREWPWRGAPRSKVSSLGLDLEDRPMAFGGDVHDAQPRRQISQDQATGAVDGHAIIKQVPPISRMERSHLFAAAAIENEIRNFALPQRREPIHVGVGVKNDIPDVVLPQPSDELLRR